MYLIDGAVLDEIKRNLTRPETGGILGVNSGRVVTSFYYDRSGQTTATHYIPDVKKLNEIIRSWAREGIEFVGFVHAHPSCDRQLSTCDLNYARKIKAHCSLTELLMLLYVLDEKEQSEEKFIQYVL